MTTKDNMEGLQQTAERAVAQLEAVELGDAWADAAGETARAISELRGGAVAAVFTSSLSPTSGGTLRDLERCVRQVDGVSVAAIVSAFVVQHGQAVAGEHLELATALRSPRGFSALRRVLGDFAPRIARPSSEVEAEGTETAQTAIAAQLIEAGQLEPAARILAEAVPVLQGRLDDATVNHRAHAADEAARIEAERDEADAVVQREKDEAQRQADAEAAEAERAAARARYLADQQRAAALADRVESVGEHIRVGNQSFSTRDVAAALRRGDFSAERARQIEAALHGAAA